MENDKLVLVALREYRLTGGRASRKFGDIVETSASVVVASKTDDSIDASARLVVVPYGDGELRLKRKNHRASVTVTEHYFGGSAKTSQLRLDESLLRLPFAERSAAGVLVEWIELNFTST
jgi:hypothetical protein